MKPEKLHLEEFILNNRDLERLEGLLAQFNIFETLNIVNAEIRHSAVLAWLLTPGENHGCGEYFVKLFLKYIFSTNRDYLKGGITIFNLESFEYGDLEVRREWNNIDILLVSQMNNFVVVIENKIGSSEHGGQLQRYWNIVEKEFTQFEKIYVYLTPEGGVGSDENWLVFDYRIILSIIEGLIEHKKSSINENILSFLKQYCVILRRYVVSNSEIEQICKSIYQKHKTALDLIFQHKPDLQLELHDYLIDLIVKQDVLVQDNSSKTCIRFTSREIDGLVPIEGKGWTSTGRMLLFEFQNNEDRLVLKLLIGPGPDKIREILFNTMHNNLTLFNYAKTAYGTKWNTVYLNEFLKKRDYEDGDADALKVKIDKRFDQFINFDLPRINEYFTKNVKIENRTTSEE